MDDTRPSLTRRRFLEAAGAAVGALGLAPVLGAGAGTGRAAAPSRAGSRPGPRPADLPPRTVGLRTLGGDFRFDPVGLAVSPGDTVRWLNMGDFHTTTAFHPDNADLVAPDVPLRIPEGADPWHSGMLGMTAGTQFEHTVRVPGVYDYFCQPHYSFGMVGRLVATGPDGGTPEARPLSELNEASREQMPAVETVVGPAGRTFEWASRLNGILFLRANDGAADDAAGALASSLEGDAELQGVLDRAGQADRFRAQLGEVVRGAREGIAYQQLLGRIDAAKDVLAAARSG
jgi:plastocyanin